MKRALRFLLSISILWFGTQYGFAQTAQIAGTVSDQQNGRVTDARVISVNQATGVEYKAVSNSEGYFSIPFLQPGIYKTFVSAKGFNKAVTAPITLSTGQVLALDITLKVGDEQQTVIVNGESSFMNTTDATVSTVVNQVFVENEPLNGRSMQSLMTLVPGVMLASNSNMTGTGRTGEITVDGQRSESNFFTVDGVSANTGVQTQDTNVGYGFGYAGVLPSSTALGTTQSLLSLDSLQEFRASTSSYSAAYGHSPGGQFELTSRSGTNATHGTLYNYFRNDAMDANNWFNDYNGIRKQAERQNDFGGVVSGPVVLPKLYNGKDRTFYFFSYEGMRLRLPQPAAVSSVPDSTLRTTAPAALQPFLNAFPQSSSADLAPGLAEYIDSSSSPSNINAPAVRLDHMFNDRFKAFTRYAQTGSDSITYFYAQGATTSNSVKSSTTALIAQISPRMVNDLRVNYTASHSNTNEFLTTKNGATPFNPMGYPGIYSSSIFDVILYWGGQFTYISLVPQFVHQNQFNLVDTLAWTAGRHSFKAGLDVRRLSNSQSYHHSEAIAYFMSESALLNNTPTFGIIEATNVVDMEPIYKDFSAFLQDDWRATSRLTLSYGVRWETNPAPKDADGNDPYTLNQTSDLSTATVAPRGTQLWKTPFLNFAPRVGVAYRLRDNTRYSTVLRTGAGIYFDTNATYASIGYLGLGYMGSASGAGTPFPFTQTQFNTAVSNITVGSPYNDTVYAFNEHLQLPYTVHWNVSVEQSLGENQTLTVGYVASDGRRLLSQKTINPEKFGNTMFSGGYGVNLTGNDATSSYNSLQVKFQRQFSHGLQALASYVWAHSIDDATSNVGTNEAILLRSSSDFDVRHAAQAALSYDLPKSQATSHVAKLTNGWGLDLILSAQTAEPVDVLTGSSLIQSNGYTIDFNPNCVAGKPQYLYGSQYPGGRIINSAAYSVAMDGSGNLIEGNAGRNSARGFGNGQIDFALRRTFDLTERTNLRFRIEAFNITNHPQFGDVSNNMSLSTFGYATDTRNVKFDSLNSLYQTGGPRSLQASLRLAF